jgi:hypothetical protein
MAGKVRKRSDEASSFQPCGIIWYRRTDYPDVLRVMADAGEMPPTFDDWLEMAEAQRRQLEFLGEVVVKVHVDPRSFVAWCRERGLSPDRRGRNEYAAHFAAHAFRRREP